MHVQPPVSQGIILAESLAILDGVNLREMTPADRIHWMVEAIKCAFADRWRYLGDPRTMLDRTHALLAPEFIKSRREAIQPLQAQTITPPGTLRETNTTYFCIADKAGNTISFIQSLYHPFGCGVVIEATGILLNNRMRGFSLDPQSPNYLQPGKRPIHTLNAYLITRRGALAFVGGTPGGDIQVQTNLQVISHLVDFERDPQSAIEQPRWAWQPTQSTEPSPGTLSIEVPPAEREQWNMIIEELRKRGHSVQANEYGTHPSAVQLIQRMGDAWGAGSDPRTEGLAAGF